MQYLCQAWFVAASSYTLCFCFHFHFAHDWFVSAMFSLVGVCCIGELLIGTSNILLSDLVVESDCLHLPVVQFAG